MGPARPTRGPSAASGGFSAALLAGPAFRRALTSLDVLEARAEVLAAGSSP